MAQREADEVSGEGRGGRVDEIDPVAELTPRRSQGGQNEAGAIVREPHERHQMPLPRGHAVRPITHRRVGDVELSLAPRIKIPKRRQRPRRAHVQTRNGASLIPLTRQASSDDLDGMSGRAQRLCDVASALGPDGGVRREVICDQQYLHDVSAKAGMRPA